MCYVNEGERKWALALDANELYCKACDIIARSRDLTQWMMKRGFIPEAPE